MSSHFLILRLVPKTFSYFKADSMSLPITSALACEKKEPVSNLFSWSDIYTTIFQSSSLIFQKFNISSYEEKASQKQETEPRCMLWFGCCLNVQPLNPGAQALEHWPPPQGCKLPGISKLTHRDHSGKSVNTSISGWVVSQKWLSSSRAHGF